MEDKVHAAVPGLAQTRQERAKQGRSMLGGDPGACRKPCTSQGVLPHTASAWACDREACCPGGKASLEMGRVYSSHTRLGNPVTSSCKPHCETVSPRHEGWLLNQNISVWPHCETVPPRREGWLLNQNISVWPHCETVPLRREGWLLNQNIRVWPLWGCYLWTWLGNMRQSK